MGGKRAERLDRIVRELDGIVESARALEERYATQLDVVHASQEAGARNLLHYLALRHGDVRELQHELASFGLSSLGRCEAHVLASVYAVRDAVRHLRGEEPRAERPPVSFRHGAARIRKQTNELFGRKLRGGHARIMVTLPREAAHDYALVRDMVRAGMNVARINLAHDDAATWESMVRNVHRARASTGCSCRVFMDLCGPKIRIGDLVPGPEALRIDPARDEWGRVEEPEVLRLVPDGSEESGPGGVRLPISVELFERLRCGDRLELEDARGKPVAFEVVSAPAGPAAAHCRTRAFLRSELPVTLRAPDGSVRGSGAIGRLPEVRAGIRLRVGDTLLVHKDPRPGEEARPGANGAPALPAHVPCAVPEVLDAVRVGHELVFDDGKIRGVVREVGAGEVRVEITHAQPGGTNLRAFKGINLPDSQPGLFGLTEKDAEDLPFVVEHADGVNVSFINHPDDVEDLLDALESAGGHRLRLVLKIETMMGVRHLPGILLAAMEWPAVGVMIARGDLAAEVGWERLAAAQEEILWLCEAAHLPVVWATEVLNQLAKKGIPTRGEISDVVMAERAECVMLNKGPYITTAIRTLDNILSSVQAYQEKKTALLPTLTLEMPDPEEVGRAVGTRRGRWT